MWPVLMVVDSAVVSRAMVNSSALLLGHNYLGGAFLLVVLFSFLINFILSVDTKAAQQARAIVKPQLFFSGTG